MRLVAGEVADVLTPRYRGQQGQEALPAALAASALALAAPADMEFQ